MEQSTTTEDSVVSSGKRFDEIDRPAPAVVAGDAGGPPPSASSLPRQPPDGGFFVAPEFSAGKIAAMKRQLSNKGLDLNSKTAGVPVAGAGTIMGVGAGTVTSGTRSSGKELEPKRRDAVGSSASPTPVSFQEQFDGLVSKAQSSLGVSSSDQDEAAKSAPGAGHCLSPTLSKGKIQSMKKELVAKGLAIDPEVAAALAAAGIISGSNGADGGLAEAIAAEFEEGKIAAMKAKLMSEGLDLHAAAAAVAAAMAANPSSLKSANGADGGWLEAALGNAAQGDAAVDTGVVEEKDATDQADMVTLETMDDSSVDQEEGEAIVEATDTKMDTVGEGGLDEEKLDADEEPGATPVEEIVDAAARAVSGGGESQVDVPVEDVPLTPAEVPSVPAGGPDDHAGGLTTALECPPEHMESSSSVLPKDPSVPDEVSSAPEGPSPPARVSSESAEEPQEGGEGPREPDEGPSEPTEGPPEPAEDLSAPAGPLPTPSEGDVQAMSPAPEPASQLKAEDAEDPLKVPRDEHVSGHPPTPVKSGEGESNGNGRAIPEPEDGAEATGKAESAAAQGIDIVEAEGVSPGAADIAPDTKKATGKVTLPEGKLVEAKSARIKQQVEPAPSRRSSTPDRRPERRLSSSSRRDSASSSQRRTTAAEKEAFVAVRPRPGGRNPSTSPAVVRVAGSPQQGRYVSPQAQQPRVAASLAAERSRRRMESPSTSGSRGGGRRSNTTVVTPPTAASRSASSTPGDERTTSIPRKVERANPVLPGAGKSGSPAVISGGVESAGAAAAPMPPSLPTDATPGDQRSAVSAGRAHRANPLLPASSTQSPGAAAGASESGSTGIHQSSHADTVAITPSAPPPRSARSTPGSGRAPYASPLVHGTSTTVSPAAIPVVRRGRSPESQQQARRSPSMRNQGPSPGASPGQGSMVTPVRAVHVTGGSPGTAVVTPSSSERAGERLHNQARETRERLERRRKDGASPVAVEGLSPFTPRRIANPQLGNPSLSGMERVERLYRDAIQRESKLEMTRKMEEENPRDCTFTPKISARASSRGRSQSRGRSPRRDSDGGSRCDRSLSRFQVLYDDAEHRRAKMEERTNARIAEVAGPGSPVITARGRARSREPLDVRLRENAERWVRHRDQLEERRRVQEREGCTFKPEFKTTRSASAPRTGNRSRDSGSEGPDAGPVEPFYVRAERYLAAREQRLEQLKREVEAREKAEATFQPNVSPGLDGEGEEEGQGSSSERSHRRKSSKGRGSSSGRSNDVFERLLRAATEQELHKAALKEAYLKQEREEFHDFQPRLPAKLADSGPSVPLETRLQESTAQWVQSREDRERRRIEMEEEQCTFRPSIGFSSSAGSDAESSGSAGSGSRRPRRSASADARLRSRSSQGVGASEGASFQARTRAFQEAREKRLNKLREEKQRQELSEATFHPSIGFGNNPRAFNGTSEVQGGRGSGEVAVTGSVDGAPARDAQHGAGENAPKTGKVPVEKVKQEQVVESRRARRSKAKASGPTPAPAAPVVEASLSKAAQKKEGRSKAAGERDGFKAKASRRAATTGSATQPVGATVAEDEVVRQEPRNERNDAADRSGRDVPLPTGTQVSLPSEAPPGSGQQFALPDRKMPIVAKVSSGTFKGEGAGNGAGNGAGVANLQQALQQARRKRELQQEAEAAAASAADALALATGPTRDAAAFETKEVPDEGDSAQLRSQGVSKRNTVQGVDVNELSARLELLAADSGASIPAESSRSNGGKKVLEDPVVSVPSAMDTHGELGDGEAFSVPPPLDQGIAAPLSVTQPVSGEDDEEDAHMELGAMIAKSQKRAADMESTMRSSPGAEDSEAGSATDAETSRFEKKPAGAVKVDEDEVVQPKDEQVGDARDLDDGRGCDAGKGPVEGQGEEGDHYDAQGAAKGAVEDYGDDHHGEYEDGEEYDDEEDDDAAFRYSSDAFRAGPKPTRSMADFDRFQREIEAKLRAL